MKFRLRDYLQPVNTLRFHRLMNEAPFWDQSRLTDWVGATRRALVKHAAGTVPHYGESLAAAGVRLDRLDDETEWQRIPTVTKSDVVDNTQRFVSSIAARHAVWASTSGSTGMPMKILLDSNINAAAFALFWRAWSTGGHWRLGQRHAVMKNHPMPGVVNHNRVLRAMEAVPRRIDASTARMVRDAFAGYKPRFLRGYPSAMFLFCRLLEEQGLELHVPMVISGSETLYEYHRAKIEAVLKTRVINHYTHWERASSILECEHGSLHAQQDFGYHELLDRSGRPVGPGVEGEITVTGLHNASMPFIRYRTGDIAVWGDEPCPCGRSFPVVKHILGRNSDFLIRLDGAIFGGISIVSFMRQLTDVRYVQIVQSVPGAVTVKVVRAPNYSELTTKRIARDLQHLCENQMEVSIEFCEIEGLERSPVGKVRQFISRVAPGHDPLRVQAS